MRKTKSLASLALAAAMLAGSVPAAFAADVSTAGSTGTTPINITAAATTFSVAVPTSIPISVDANGVVTCPAASAVTITNNSAGPVQVTKVSMANGEWNLASYNGGDRSAMAAAGVDAKKLGFQMKAGSDTAATTKDGAQDLTIQAAQWSLGGKDTGANALPITCAAIATASSAAVASEKAADVVFTISWKTA